MDGGERSVAGRKTMKGGETKDVHSGKEAPKYPDTSKDKEDGDEKKENTETEEDHAIETELITILKKSPSKLPIHKFLIANCRLANKPPTYSHNFQQILLPLLCESETNTPGEIYYCSCSLCG